MAVPKKKTSKCKKRMRRSHLALNIKAFRESKDTGEMHIPHHIDLKTGMYRGKQVLDI